jgi:eukaryotic-like serine/threonine-protein kinase
VEVWNNYIYLPADNRNLYCFNKETGDSIWAFKMDATSYTPARVSDGIVYTGTLNRTCYAVDAITGNLVWSYQTVGSINQIPPQFYGDRVAFISGAIIICDKKNGNLIADISTRTGGKYEYFSAIWDTDGKMYLTGYNTNSEHFVLVHQF